MIETWNKDTNLSISVYNKPEDEKIDGKWWSYYE